MFGKAVKSRRSLAGYKRVGFLCFCGHEPRAIDFVHLLFIPFQAVADLARDDDLTTLADSADRFSDCVDNSGGHTSEYLNVRQCQAVRRSEDQIKDITPVMTIVDGKIAYRSK